MKVKGSALEHGIFGQKVPPILAFLYRHITSDFADSNAVCLHNINRLKSTSIVYTHLYPSFLKFVNIIRSEKSHSTHIHVTLRCLFRSTVKELRQQVTLLFACLSILKGCRTLSKGVKHKYRKRHHLGIWAVVFIPYTLIRYSVEILVIFRDYECERCFK